MLPRASKIEFVRVPVMTVTAALVEGVLWMLGKDVCQKATAIARELIKNICKKLPLGFWLSKRCLGAAPSEWGGTSTVPHPPG